MTTKSPLTLNAQVLELINEYGSINVLEALVDHITLACLVVDLKEVCKFNADCLDKNHQNPLIIKSWLKDSRELGKLTLEN